MYPKTIYSGDELYLLARYSNMSKRILIAYFSRKGTNFVNGSEKELESGNTEKVARFIKDQVGGDLFEITPAIPYSDNYKECVDQAKAEKESNARPAVKNKVQGMEDYEVIFLGYPNWWGTCPMPVLSFLEAYNLADKTVIPFCTHSGAGVLYSQADIEGSAKGAKVLKAASFNGAYLKEAAPTIEEWLKGLKDEL
jgi:flavodoxin